MAIREADRGACLRKLHATLAAPSSDPLELAGRWENLLKGEDDFSVEQLVVILQKWVFDLAEAKFACRPRFGAGEWGPLSTVLERASAGGLIRCYNELLRIRRLAGHTLNLRLLLEEIAERYLRVFAIRQP